MIIHRGINKICTIGDYEFTVKGDVIIEDGFCYFDVIDGEVLIPVSNIIYMKKIKDLKQ
jgi:hypothetical protein